jgi:hypothetical protein
MFANKTTSPLFPIMPPRILQSTIHPIRTQHSPPTCQAGMPRRVPRTSYRIRYVNVPPFKKKYHVKSFLTPPLPHDFVPDLLSRAMTRVTVPPLTATAVWALALPTPASEKGLVDANDDAEGDEDTDAVGGS